MRFTFWSVGVPAGVLFLEMLIFGMPDSRGFHGPVPGLFLTWFWCGMPVVGIYWLVRLVRLAWRSN